MADFVTLDTFLSGDPAAADNSPGSVASPGAAVATVPAPAGPDVTARIAELESLVSRHRQQLDGSRQEITRLSTALQDVQNRPPPAPTPPQHVQPPSRPRKELEDAAKRFVLDGDEAALAEFQAQQQAPAPPALTLDQVRDLLAQQERERDAKQRVTTVATTLQQAVAQRHPELLNVDKHPAFVTATATRYQQIMADPVTQFRYPPDPAALFTDPNTQVQYDMRVLLEAADSAKARLPVAPPPPTLGAPGAYTAPPQSGPVVPRSMVQGPDAVLQDPAVQKALADMGWGGTLKEQLATMLKHTPETTRNRWQRGEL